ncbi:four-carbon acid sugar kinase family protein [Glycomyces harbinensis]|uniref:Uncharacterized conserved protein YgbK, DUF1537 family n=1 Tax=Glycomyces harbinensis TaxID=58114 RepID=A0A1G7AUR8_9ACTN|nr:four-carbon acid sugar kinase family protein [Glycomyces harbinensis]SDE17745.1 Uncharacterized conserved protein YgbK, DUF1537 family [Glycomyces harbinensis]
MPHVAVVADDMTGAADCALAFGEAGWRAHLELGDGWTPFPGDDAHAAAAFSTDARASADARAATERAVRAARAAGADRIYLKVDSTGRGTLADQIAGARAALDDPLTVICPAFPAVGRTVEAGRLRVDGREATEGVAGADPITPLRSSDLTVLVPGARTALAGATGARTADRLPAEPSDSPIADRLLADDSAAREEDRSTDGASGPHADRLVAGASGPLILDATTEGDLDRLAVRIADLEERQPVLAVGSAGLARALARVWHSAPHDVTVPAPGTDLVVVSSLNPATRAQVAHAEAHGAVHGELDVERMSDAELEAAVGDLLRSGRPAIASTSAPVAEKTSLGGNGPDLATVPRGSAEPTEGVGAQRIAQRLGAAAARAVLAERPGVVGFVGGDGASAALTALGEPRALVAGRIAPGVPLLRLPVTGLAAWTKAGGFGPPTLLTDLIFPVR